MLKRLCTLLLALLLPAVALSEEPYDDSAFRAEQDALNARHTAAWEELHGPSTAWSYQLNAAYAQQYGTPPGSRWMPFSMQAVLPEEGCAAYDAVETEARRAAEAADAQLTAAELARCAVGSAFYGPGEWSLYDLFPDAERTARGDGEAGLWFLRFETGAGTFLCNVYLDGQTGQALLCGVSNGPDKDVTLVLYP